MDRLNCVPEFYFLFVSNSKCTSTNEFSFKFKGDMFGFFDVGGPEVGKIEFLIVKDQIEVIPSLTTK